MVKPTNPDRFLETLLSAPPVEIAMRLISSIEDMCSEMKQMNNTLNRLVDGLCVSEEEIDEEEDEVEEEPIILQEKTETRFI